MPKKISIDIQESVDFLEKSFAKIKEPLKKDRIKTLLYIKKNQSFSQSEIAKKLGRTEKTIRTWLQTYILKGFSGLLEVVSGGNNTRTISDKMILLIDQKLNDSNTIIKSYVELKAILEEESGEKIDYGALYSHCRRKYKSKLKILLKSNYKKNKAHKSQ